MENWTNIFDRENTVLMSVIPFVFQNWLFFIAGLLFCRVYLFYIRRSKYPPGPFPFPCIGNLPAFAIVGGSFHRAAETWRADHGEIFTVWIGEKPWIFINSLNAILECNSNALQNYFAGRTRTNTGDVQMQGNVGVIFSDYGIPQQALRSLSQQAIRKYLSSCGPRKRIIVPLVDKIVSENENVLIESKQIAEELVQALATQTMFGSQPDRASQQELRDAHRALEENCPSGLPSDVMPILKYILWSRERAGMNAFHRYNKIARDLCKRTADAYFRKDPEQIECIMDAVQFSVREPSVPVRRGEDHLTPGNVSQVVFDLFEAGSQTSVISLNWALLECASKQDIQQELYQEIAASIDALGDLPDKRDKQTLPRLQSFLKEVVRYWPAAPFGLPRKLLRQTRIGPYILPTNSTILFNLHSANRDPAYWRNGHKFIADRFIDSDGHFDDRTHKGFVAFGLGPRACVGSQMAMENLFFIMARILQKWRILPDAEGSILAPFPAALMLDAKIQNIKLIPRSAT